MERCSALTQMRKPPYLWPNFTRKNIRKNEVSNIILNIILSGEKNGT